MKQVPHIICLLLSLLVGPFLSFLRSFFPIVTQEDKACRCKLVSFGSCAVDSTRIVSAEAKKSETRGK